jgi:hypothetical protein
MNNVQRMTDTQFAAWWGEQERARVGQFFPCCAHCVHPEPGSNDHTWACEDCLNGKTTMRIAPDFTTFSHTLQVIHVDEDGGAGVCDKCCGSLILSYNVITEGEHTFKCCSICVPGLGDFIRIAA